MNYTWSTTTSSHCGDGSSYHFYYDKPYKNKPATWEDVFKINWDKINQVPKPEKPTDIFSREETIITKDGESISLTLGELYELEKLGLDPTKMTKEELEQQLLAIRL